MRCAATVTRSLSRPRPSTRSSSATPMSTTAVGCRCWSSAATAARSTPTRPAVTCSPYCCATPPVSRCARPTASTRAGSAKGAMIAMSPSRSRSTTSTMWSRRCAWCARCATTNGMSRSRAFRCASTMRDISSGPRASSCGCARATPSARWCSAAISVSTTRPSCSTRTGSRPPTPWSWRAPTAAASTAAATRPWRSSAGSSPPRRATRGTSSCRRSRSVAARRSCTCSPRTSRSGVCGIGRCSSTARWRSRPARSTGGTASVSMPRPCACGAASPGCPRSTTCICAARLTSRARSTASAHMPSSSPAAACATADACSITCGTTSADRSAMW